MKIGILTFHRAINYGAIFQAYGLNNYVQSLGHDVEFIDYWPKSHSDEYELFNRRHFNNCSLLGKCRYIFEFLLKYKNSKRRQHSCIEFIKANFNLKNEASILTGNQIVGSYDVVFYGSDQIWRRSDKISDNRGFDKIYYGEYPKNKCIKVSYAASMGVVNLNPNDKDVLKKLLSNFNHIAVREKNLLNVVKELGYSATLTVDPVFLLNKKQWISLIPDTYKKITHKYIFFYHHTFSEEAVQLVKLLSKQLNCKIIEVNAEALPYAIAKKYKNDSSPSEFLGLIHNAEFVVTTSFHGTVFSVIMEKQFFALGMRNNSERSKTLLAELGIPDRYLDDINKLPTTTIDYKVLAVNQNRVVENSKEYIQMSMN